MATLTIALLFSQVGWLAFALNHMARVRRLERTVCLLVDSLADIEALAHLVARDDLREQLAELVERVDRLDRVPVGYREHRQPEPTKVPDDPRGSPR